MMARVQQNEMMAAEAFSNQSVVFDKLYGSNSLIRYKRNRVRSHLEQFLRQGSSILEINAGTGEDAVYLAGMGHSVHATDISEGMLSVLKDKAAKTDTPGKLSYERVDFTQLAQLVNKGPYDHIFSNFAGLNCTQQIGTVLKSFSPLLRDNGAVTMVLLPAFCLWESLLLFKGKFRTAFRRFSWGRGVNAHVEGVHFKCWYYNPSRIVSEIGNDFEVLKIEGLCTIVPPSYMDRFAEKHPLLYRLLAKWEDKWKSAWPWRSIGDYYIITLRKR